MLVFFFRQIYIWFSYDKRCNKGFKCSKNAQFHTDFSKNFASILISLNRVRSCNSYLGIISVFFRQIYRYISNDKRCNNGLKCSKMHNFTLIFPKKFRPPLAPPTTGGLRPPLRNWPVAPLVVEIKLNVTLPLVQYGCWTHKHFTRTLPAKLLLQ